MPTTIYSKMQQRYDTAAAWTTSDPILLEGEIGIESDTNKFKIGDGVTVWNSLAYASVDLSVSSIDELSDVEVVTPAAGHLLRYSGTAWQNESLGISDLADVDTTTITPTAGQVLTWNSTDSKWVPADQAAGGGGATLAIVPVQTTTLAPGQIADFTLTAGYVYQLLSVDVSQPAWIRFYGSDNARADDSRTSPGGNPPAAGSEFYAELATTSVLQTIRLSPVPTVQAPFGLTYVRVRNDGTTTGAISLTLTVLILHS